MMPLMGLLADWTQLRKESLSLRVCPYNLKKQREQRLKTYRTEY